MLIRSDARAIPLADDSVQCCITSPPYWGLRDYGLTPSVWGGDRDCEHLWGSEIPGDARGGSGPGAKEFYADGGKGVYGRKVARGNFCQECGAWNGVLGLEPSFEQHLEHLVLVFREIRRVLRPDGTLFLNYGDAHAANRSYQVTDNKHRDVGNTSGSKVPSGLKPKDLILMPWRLVLALQADGWWIRQWMPWVKRNPMPESTEDRPTSAVEVVFMLTKTDHNFYDREALRTAPKPRTEERMKYSFDKSATAWGSSSGHHGANPQENRRPDKQRGHSRRHAGFNDCWDAMEKSEQQANGRSFRNSDLMFQSLESPFGLVSDADGTPLVIDVTPQALRAAHFATFPERLVEPFVRGGTSERGACEKCRAPWERVVEKHIAPTAKAAKRCIVDGRDLAADKNSQGSNRQKDGHMPGYVSANKTTGWRPTCDCYDELYRAYPQPKGARKRSQRAAWPGRWKRVKNSPGKDEWSTVPCTVLDPFSGSGTTVRVATRFNRRGIGCDLSYHDIATQRTKDVQRTLFDA